MIAPLRGRRRRRRCGRFGAALGAPRGRDVRWLPSRTERVPTPVSRTPDRTPASSGFACQRRATSSPLASATIRHGLDRLLPPQRAPDPPHRDPGDARPDGPRGLRRRRAHRAPRGERHGPLPRAPRVQGRPEVRRLPQGQRDGRAHGRGAQRLHVARPRRLPHHLPRRGRRRGDRPADRLRRAAEDRRRGARPRARRRDPGDRALQRPAVGRRRAPDRPRRVRRPPARAPGARPGGAPAHVHARGDRRVPHPPVGGQPRRCVPRRQPRLAARRRRAGRGVLPLPLDHGQRRLRARARVLAADAGRGARLQPVAPADVLPARRRPPPTCAPAPR